MMEFGDMFKALTGYEPLSWQRRLYNEWLAGDIAPVIDLPTGMGKTNVMAIWLIARAARPQDDPLRLPTRLVYVVDRRTVVDQATTLAKKIMDGAAKAEIEPPTISTLRGQHADNREWSRDPSRPAIIIGTVDLIGSGLLFSGYRSSYKRRPLEAGLLGQDSLLILDEAHLSKPFEKLISEICDRGRFQKDRDGNSCGMPMKVISMSATSAPANGDVFRLEGDFDTSTGDFADNRIRQRYGAAKTLKILPPIEKGMLNAGMADSAVEWAKNNSRVVVFVRSPDDATKIAEKIREHGDKKNKPFKDAVAILTGTIRGLERDELLRKPVMKRFLKPENEAAGGPAILVSTSAGEVGFDLNADHMVCDTAPLDSMIQRLGRVNRRGTGDGTILLCHQLIKTTDKDGKRRKLEGIEKSIATTLELLDGVSNVSPKNFAALKGSDKWQEKYKDACLSEPPMVELTDILLDNWSMTSITEPMPGRPEVGPWLRGIDKDQAQTSIAWRAELELFRHNASPEKSLEAVFAKHSIRPHESLTVNTRHLIDEFLKNIPKLKDRPSDLMATRTAIRLSRGQIACRSVQELIDKPGILYADSTLILPATFGGLNSAGMLSADAIPPAPQPNDPPLPSLDIADHPGYEPFESSRSRLRIVIKKSDGMWSAETLPGGNPIPEDISATLKLPFEKTTLIFNALKGADLRVRLVQPVDFDDEGDAVKSIVILAPAPKDKKKENQSLADHVGEVKTHAIRIANALEIDDSIRAALIFAAQWHDEGKKARIWQTFANNPDPNAPPLGKMAQSRDPKSLKHYRHEFGSLLRIHHPDRCDKIDCTLPSDEPTRNIAIHLIATHHGGGRPHFPVAVYDPFNDDERDALHTESIRRFAQLQQKYGWWHLAWLENLLRCADQLASADEEVTEIDELERGER